MKKRFGISVPSGIASQLDKITALTGSDRSSVIVQAIENYLHEDLHVDEEHSCSGVVIYHGALSLEDIESIDLHKVVKSICSVRLKAGVITVIFVEGYYGEILSLRESISKRVRIHSRFIPTHCPLSR